MTPRITDEDIETMVEEICVSGSVLLGRSTFERAKRTVKRMNRYMQHQNYQWRVKLVIDKADGLNPYQVEPIERVFPYTMIPIETIKRTLCMKGE